MKKVMLVVLGLTCFLVASVSFADLSGVGAVASTVTHNLGNLARLITAGAYVAGMAFAVAGILKLKAHKDNPSQTPVSHGIVAIFLAIALIFVPTVFKVGGATMFGQSGKTGTVSGITSF